MATEVDEVPGGFGNTKYPWVQWANGKKWHLVRGEDYTIETKAMQRAVYAHAHKTGMRAETKPSPEGLYIHFVKQDKPKKRLPRKK